MSTVTVRIPKEKRDQLKSIASLEGRSMEDIVIELVDDYIERQRETLDLPSRPGLVEAIRRGREEVAGEVKGKGLDDLGGPHSLSGP